MLDVEVDEQIDLQRLHARRVLRVALDPDRVVVVELRGRRGPIAAQRRAHCVNAAAAADVFASKGGVMMDPLC